MDNKDYILERMNDILNRYNNLKEWFIFVEFSGDDKLIRQCKAIDAIFMVVRRCIQIGYYRRAIFYIATLNNIINVVDIKRNQISDNLTKMLIE